MRSWWVLGGATLIVAACGSDGDTLFGDTTSTSSNGTGGDGGSAGSTGSTSTTSSGTAGGGPEDCLNGVDDNDNGLIDCQDVGCQVDYECVPAPPSGWDGIGWLTSKSAAECPDEMPTSQVLYDPEDLNALPATCSCSCGSPNGVQCQSALSCYNDQQCGQTLVYQSLVSTSCQQFSLFPPNWSCTTSALSVTGGSCPAGPVTDSVPTLTWPSDTSACLRETPGVCDGGEACIPRLPSGAVGPCIARAGDHPCPSGYSDKTIRYDGSYTDTRGCGPCQCSAPTGGTCACLSSSCGVSLHTQVNCVGGFMNIAPISGACVGGTLNTGAVGARLTQVQLSNAGSCAGQSSPTGSAIHQGGPITVCCMP